MSRPTVAHRNPPRRRGGLLAAAVACLALLCLPAAGQALPDAAAVQVRLDALLDPQGLYPRGTGLAVLVARGDERLAQGARGMASIELEVPLTPAHRFKIASITKQFTAAWLLELVDQGRARLDDPLSKYLADYPNGRAITLAMLLNHTAGVPSFSKIPGYLGNPIRRDLGTAQLIDEFKLFVGLRQVSGNSYIFGSILTFYLEINKEGKKINTGFTCFYQLSWLLFPFSIINFLFLVPD